MKKKSIFLFSTQSFYQTKFWIDISLKLKFLKRKSLIICFDTESENFLLKKNVKHVFIKSKIDNDKNIFKEIFKKYNFINYRTALKHEQIFYGKRNFFKILKKFLTYIIQIENLFLSLKDEKITIIQELSGFSSSLSLYYASKKFGYNNYFIEPSFFDGRFHMTLNTLMCNPVKNGKIPRDANIPQILSKIKNLKRIIIPQKDISHFINPFDKIFNLINIIRFADKLYKKLFLNIQYEFDEIFRYSFSFFKNLINYFFLYFFYSRRIKKNKVYHYFPLHVPNDFALTLRSPIYLDQINLIERLLKKIPKNELLYVKEHPGRIGALNFIDALKILSKNKNFEILYPFINSYEILENCKSVITINSKTGYEALIMNKPLFVFGESYYKKISFVSYCNLNNINLNQNKKVIQLKLNNFFKKLYYKTFNGQLYYLKKTNINNFVKSINSLNI
jgi:hypothetical protein